jgi:XTP/dITP diphosphohydrolase
VLWSGHRAAKRDFGYDPVFQPEGHQITFGEMDPDAKHAMSHRARAFAQLVGELKAAIG